MLVTGCQRTLTTKVNMLLTDDYRNFEVKKLREIN